MHGAFLLALDTVVELLTTGVNGRHLYRSSYATRTVAEILS
jgi:hypothetical protein